MRDRAVRDLRILRRQLGFDPRFFLGPVPRLLQAVGLIRPVDSQTWELTRRGKFQVCQWWGELILNRLSEAAASDTLLEPRAGACAEGSSQQ
ncbi:MAG: hypothetical protein ABI333_18795 [bacterium]